MEQPRTRPSQHAPRRRTPSPLPPQARRGRPGADGGQPAPPRGRGGVPAGARRADGDPAAAAGQRRAVTVRRPAPPAARPGGRLPNPRLTGLGSGLFCGAVMIVLGLALRALFGGSPTVYGVLFLPVCVLTAVWVRKGDLLTAPVVVPIAFAAGLVPLADGSEGLGGRLMNLVTALATEAGWLYAGTLLAGVIATTRHLALTHHRRRQTRDRGRA
ncbi:DUF6542 domain-containing protein [Streptomyces sp. NPDC014802]|uniref:DUF6542 domain-containing protein n=1 Tax=unclassified Streptomyces TaxID=2593676 RepID=UPI0036F5F30C